MHHVKKNTMTVMKPQPYILVVLSLLMVLCLESCSNGNRRYIGEQYGGGIVFDAWKDKNEQWHGVIVSVKDVGKNVTVWSAAGICARYRGGDMNDWTLPSPSELEKLHENRQVVNEALTANHGDLYDEESCYWSSKYLPKDRPHYYHYDLTYAVVMQRGITKDTSGYSTLMPQMSVRAVRRF